MFDTFWIASLCVPVVIKGQISALKLYICGEVVSPMLEREQLHWQRKAINVPEESK